MKCWKKYEQYLSSGEWHVHTSYTDGKNGVLEICQQATDLGIPLVSFTEHVRRKITYDVDRFFDDVEKAKTVFPGLIIVPGAEAKVLPDGSLDIDEALLRRVCYLTFSFHSFPDDRELYLKCLREAILNERVNAWSHPGLFLRKAGMALNGEELEEIFTLMARNDVLLEVNGKYCLPPGEWIERARKLGVRTVRGDDIHALGDFENRYKTWQ